MKVARGMCIYPLVACRWEQGGGMWHMDKVRAMIPYIIGYSMALEAHAPSNKMPKDFSLTSLHCITKESCKS